MTSFRTSIMLGACAAAMLCQPAVARDGEDGSGIQVGRLEVSPYIEAAQVLTSRLSPDSDSVTYTRIAAGVDTAISGRNNHGAVSLRYERQIGWGKDNPDADLLSGIARVSASVIPQTLSFEAGGLATSTRVSGNGGASISPLRQGDDTSKAYSVYAGPTLQTHAGDVAVTAAYRLGYSRVEAPDAVVTAPGAEPVDIFDDSTVHVANVHAGTKAGDVLPVGVGVGAGWYREDISNLDQRVDDRHVRADVTVPLAPDLAAVGGIGYEKVEISNRDVKRDGQGAPILGSDGRYVTDKSAPRQMAYDTEGLIWDAGLVWKPSDRTAAEAHVGRRYGGMTYYGSFAWRPSMRSSLNISVYDAIGGLGGRLNSALVDLPTDFKANRNPLTGDLGACVTSAEKGSCIGGLFGSIRSATFRSRGIMATYSVDLGRIQAGVGAGYDRRKFKAAKGTILGLADGLADENIWATAYLNGAIDERSSFSTAVYANWFDSGFDLAGSAHAMGATASYNRSLTRRLTASAAVGIDGISRKALEDEWIASALVGMRYSF